MEKKNKRNFLFREITKEFCSGRDNLLGRILTIVDSAFADQVQRKAVKDLVQKEFYSDSTFHISDMMIREIDAFLNVFTEMEKSIGYFENKSLEDKEEKYKEIK